MSDCSERPAAGYRFRDGGALDGVGAEGSSWSSSPYDASGHEATRLIFLGNQVGTLTGGPRTLGRTVRCVQHLLAKLL